MWGTQVMTRRDASTFCALEFTPPHHLRIQNEADESLVGYHDVSSARSARSELCMSNVASGITKYEATIQIVRYDRSYKTFGSGRVLSDLFRSYTQKG